MEISSVKNQESKKIVSNTAKAATIGAGVFGALGPGGGRLTCCGDEPYNQSERPYAEGSRWLLHEAFCLERQADVFKPYQKHHSTAADACRLAEELGVENLILYHTEDRNIARRKALYTAEGGPLFSGNLFVPEDLEVFEL